MASSLDMRGSWREAESARPMEPYQRKREASILRVGAFFP
jgi:hypothetical protein